MSALPGGPSGTNGLGPPAPSIRRDRTWPGQSRQACVTWTERTRGGGAGAPARRRPCQAKAALCEGGVARIRRRGARTGLLVEDFLFHAAAAPIPTRPPFLGSLGPTEGDARCPYGSGTAARAFAHSAACFRLASVLPTLAARQRRIFLRHGAVQSVLARNDDPQKWINSSAATP